VTQTLSVLSEDFLLPFLAGIAVFMFTSGICVLRHGGLPRWLGWVAIVIGVVSLTPIGFVGFLAVFVCVLVASIVLYLRGAETPITTTPSPAAPTA
jgi:hypothetical protein